MLDAELLGEMLKAIGDPVLKHVYPFTGVADGDKKTVLLTRLSGV